MFAMDDLPLHERAIMRLLFAIRENRYPIDDKFDIVERFSQSECTLFYLASYVHDMMRDMPLEVYEHAVDKIDRRIKYLEETPVAVETTTERKVA
jgi:hypothetical protein